MEYAPDFWLVGLTWAQRICSVASIGSSLFLVASLQRCTSRYSGERCYGRILALLLIGEVLPTCGCRGHLVLHNIGEWLTYGSLDSALFSVGHHRLLPSDRCSTGPVRTSVTSVCGGGSASYL